MNILLALQRPFIWLSRIRYRCGYGVHSPFAFELITCLIYERTPYYAYSDLMAEQKRLAPHSGKGWNSESTKVNQLLFRLVNRLQPHTLVDAGALSASSLYLQAGKSAADYLFASDLSELFLEAGASIDFLYLHFNKNVALTEEVFQICAQRINSQTLFVVRGIHSSRSMKALWKRLQADERVGITFDLYDLGLLFFDRSKIKQHYIVNF